MIHQVAERQMHLVRWIITSAWLAMIASLLFDPITPWLTQSDALWSPLRVDPTVCVQVQGHCLPRQPYALGTTIFWGVVVPTSIFILLIFGHDLWRRICPLSFLSQIPRALGWQRHWKHVNPQTGKVRLELAKVKPNSWLGQNYPYLQFGFLFVGLCARILFINADRTALFLWFVMTIVAAITVGYLYGGKTWCNYFCPMAPVQKIYAEPAGFFNSQAHTIDTPITQSMCRILNEDGKEQSACVACQTPCIDIDSERSYWDGLMKPETKFLYYSYFGLVVGYFCYYYLYAGNWNYYFSGAWAYQVDQLTTLFDPGFYLFGQPIAIPKILAVPLTLGGFSAIANRGGRWVETGVQSVMQKRHRPLSREMIQHRIFTVCTFLVFHVFFIFAGRPLLLLLPLSVQFLYEMVLVGLSTLWVYRTWHRTPEQYSRESLTSRLRRQLAKLQLNVTQFLDGRSLEDLNTDEVFVLAKVLPGFTKEKRHEAYKGVLREALEEGYVNTASSLEVLQQMRSQLTISDDEHRAVLTELGVEDPQLLDPNRQRSRENQVRLTGYRHALERLVRLQQRQLDQTVSAVPTKHAIEALLSQDIKSLRALRRAYSITLQEQTEVLEDLDPETHVVRRSEFLLSQLYDLTQRYHALQQPDLQPYEWALTLLQDAVVQKQRLLINGLFTILEQLEQQGFGTIAWKVATAIVRIAPSIVQTILDECEQQKSAPTSWYQRLTPAMIQQLRQSGQDETNHLSPLSIEILSDHLTALTTELNPLIQAVSLYLLYHISPDIAQQQADSLLKLEMPPAAIVQEVAATIAQSPTPPKLLAEFGHLERVVALYRSDFFGGIQGDTLMTLADRATVQSYQPGVVITEAGDTCRELLVLIEGAVDIQRHRVNGEVVTESLLPGVVLDELEVLSHQESMSTIVAKAPMTRVLAIPVDAVDDLLEHDREFARRILELESRRLQQLLAIS